MSGKRQPRVKTLARQAWRQLRHAGIVLRLRGPSQAQFWLLALLIGIAAGFAALAFRNGIAVVQRLAYGTDDVMLATHAGTLPWWLVLVIPIIGGLVVGLILHNFTPDGRARAGADVIEDAALHDGRVERRAGLASAAASMITLGAGGSSGREGPVVHLAGVISSWVCARMNAGGITGRDLLGCAVAAGVSASFNAPIAGTIFALEVVLRHYAVHAFAPIAIAAVAGTVVSRLQFGDVTEFTLEEESVLHFYVELPAFMLLGLVSGLVAVALMRAIFVAEDFGNILQARTGLPRWLRPAIAGAMLGAIAIWFPHIIGVGYEVTSQALTGQLLLHEAVVFCLLKVIAVAITLGGRMGGGVFSPSLVVGALTGLAFGLIATGLFPEISGSATLYALAGMGAVAAAVLGAPISTTLIVFELTGDWQTGLAVMTAVSLSTALSSRLVARSFFLTQLDRRGVQLAKGPQAYLMQLIPVERLIRPVPDDPAIALRAEAGIVVDRGATLDAAMPLFDAHAVSVLPVVDLARGDETPRIVGVLHHLDALKAYNTALRRTAAEEHS